jgi:hypothetical protein
MEGLMLKFGGQQFPMAGNVATGASGVSWFGLHKFPKNKQVSAVPAIGIKFAESSPTIAAADARDQGSPLAFYTIKVTSPPNSSDRLLLSRPCAPTKAEYICADQPVNFIFRWRQRGGPYVPLRRTSPDRGNSRSHGYA